MHYGGDPYDAVGRRGGKGSVTSPPKSQNVKKIGNIKTGDIKSPKNTASPAKPPVKSVSKVTKVPPTSSSPPPDSGKIQQLEEKIEELQNIATEVEKERDFYFGKLREIEVLCQSTDPNELTKQIFSILSATDEESPNGTGETEEEEVTPTEDDETF